MITRNCIERIKNSVDIYDVVSPYVALKRCGANWRGLSPFNQEKTPSFFVMPGKKIFHCFSSGNAGDIFRFIQLQENVSFADAVEMIANRFNIPIEFEKSHGHEPRSYSRKSLFDVNEFACDFFVKNFHLHDTSGEKIRQYWTDVRKFSMDVARENRLGFAGHNDRLLVQKLLDAGFSFDTIKASGIFYYRDGETDPHRCIMRFNSRMTIPICDIQGRIVGFSARFVDGISRKDDFADAKYINSPETEIFHKGCLLFGLHRARQYLDSEDVFWMVEGQFDAMRCWDNAINTAIAPQGTAITDVQLNTLRRYTSKISCMLDGDSAGLKAAERVLPMTFAAGLDIKFFILPEGNDPDSYFREDFVNKFALLKKSSMSCIEFLASRFSINRKGITAHEKAEALTRIFEIISMSDSSVVRNSHLEELATVTTLDRYAISQDFKTFLTKRKFVGTPVVAADAMNDKPSQKLSSAEGQLLSIVLNNNDVANEVAKFMGESFLQNLSSHEGKILLKILNEIKECMWEGMHTLDNQQLFSDDERNVLYASVAGFDEDCDPVSAANVCLRKIFLDFVKGEINAINEEIRKNSLDESDTMRTLQNDRLNLRKMLAHPPQIFLIA
jgi:DNA primase